MPSFNAPKICYGAHDPVDVEDEIQQLPVGLLLQDDQPKISLHALARVTTSQTMQVRGFFKKIPLRLLIDYGSTHNFIDPRITEQADCFLHHFSRFEVIISNGGTLPCKEKCCNVRISIGDYKFHFDMFAFPLGRCDMVLGAQWLCTLGLILWDFAELWMQFSINGKNTH